MPGLYVADTSTTPDAYGSRIRREGKPALDPACSSNLARTRIGPAVRKPIVPAGRGNRSIKSV